MDKLYFLSSILTVGYMDCYLFEIVTGLWWITFIVKSLDIFVAVTFAKVPRTRNTELGHSHTLRALLSVSSRNVPIFSACLPASGQVPIVTLVIKSFASVMDKSEISFEFTFKKKKGGFPGGSVVESTCQCRWHEFDSWVGKISWRTKWQPTPVLLPKSPADRGAWRSRVHEATKSQTWLRPSAHTHTGTYY